MKKNTEVERCTVEVREKQDECKNRKQTESEKTAEKQLQMSLVLCTFFFAEDECAEINLNATGNY